MARSNSKNGKVKENAEWKGFVNVPLSTTDTLDVVEHAAGERDTDDVILELADDGYKVSVSPLRDGSGYCVSLTGRGETNPNRGFTMTTFAGTPRRGLLAAWYKVYVLCEGEAWQLPERETGLEI